MKTVIGVMIGNMNDMVDTKTRESNGITETPAEGSEEMCSGGDSSDPGCDPVFGSRSDRRKEQNLERMGTRQTCDGSEEFDDGRKAESGP
mmetsp:Transcript_2807/g.4015  ORF Transcript_2807/g.4015 Transcript_2807/m.4015 type:complete len:90 (-) Transcript_2807:191-460(-)